MKHMTRVFFTGLVAFLVALPALAQRPAPSSSNRQNGRGSTGAASTASAPAATPRVTYSAPNISTGGANFSRSTGRGYPTYISGGGSGYAIERNALDIKYSSFYSYGSYYHFQDYLYMLRMRYFLDGAYFNRFYRNREPLLTPRMQQLTLRDPLVLSNYMLAAIDELELLIQDVQAGKPVSKDAIRDKAKEIRDFAKKIRNDDLLDYIDQRKDRDITKGKDYDELGLDAIHQLREVALRLNSQLRNMYNQSTTSSISVSSLKQPSFESLSKGIDKLCKVIDKSAKRL